jgi:hypothetical protein
MHSWPEEKGAAANIAEFWGLSRMVVILRIATRYQRAQTRHSELPLFR